MTKGKMSKIFQIAPLITTSIVTTSLKPFPVNSGDLVNNINLFVRKKQNIKKDNRHQDTNVHARQPFPSTAADNSK